MTLAWKRGLVLSLFVMLFAPVALPAQAQYAQAELDQMLAPVALYPDALLSQVLMAATYPLEVNEAAAWTRANPGLRGDDAVRAAESQGWDPSVTSLAAFPQILQRMSENPEWTRALGDAFLDQEPQVMATVQQLRQRAQAAGNLQSSNELIVQSQGGAILVQPVNPQMVYVPYYDPFTIYGPWWWPAYPPVAWNPWPGYARPRPGISVNFWWGAPVAVSSGFFFGNFDWRQRQVRVVRTNTYYYRPPAVVNRTVVVQRDSWQHDPSHRRGVNYASPAVQQRFASATPRWQDEKKREQRAAPQREDTRHQVLSRPPAEQVERKAEPPKPRQATAPQTQRATQPREQHAAEAQQERHKAEVREQRATPPQARQATPPQARAEQRPHPQPRAEQHSQPRPQRDEAQEDRGDKGHKGRGPG